MKFGKGEYNLLGTSDDPIPQEEPGFLLRGQDELSVTVVRIYALLAGGMGLWDVQRSANRQADAMEAWPTKKRPSL